MSLFYDLENLRSRRVGCVSQATDRSTVRKELGLGVSVLRSSVLHTPPIQTHPHMCTHWHREAACVHVHTLGERCSIRDTPGGGAHVPVLLWDCEPGQAVSTDVNFFIYTWSSLQRASDFFKACPTSYIIPFLFCHPRRVAVRTSPQLSRGGGQQNSATYPRFIACGGADVA